jgi:hypothetical protein
MTNETDGPSKPDSGRVNASSAAIARKINRLPPGEHIVELRARAIPDQMVLRIAAFSAELQVGTTLDLDRIFHPQPAAPDVKGMRTYTSQGALWLSVLVACGLRDDELEDTTLAEVAEKISGKRVVVVINDSGYWNRARAL